MKSVLALSFAWLLVACCLLKGVKTSGRWFCKSFTNFHIIVNTNIPYLLQSVILYINITIRHFDCTSSQKLQSSRCHGRNNCIFHTQMELSANVEDMERCSKANHIFFGACLRMRHNPFILQWIPQRLPKRCRFYCHCQQHHIDIFWKVMKLLAESCNHTINVWWRYTM